MYIASILSCLLVYSFCPASTQPTNVVYPFWQIEMQLWCCDERHVLSGHHEDSHTKPWNREPSMCCNHLVEVVPDRQGFYIGLDAPWKQHIWIWQDIMVVHWAIGHCHSPIGVALSAVTSNKGFSARHLPRLGGRFSELIVHGLRMIVHRSDDPRSLRPALHKLTSCMGHCNINWT